MEGNPPVILDCDVLSTFAKTNRIPLIESLFHDSDLLMPDAVFVEIERVRQHGYDFPEKITTSRIKLTYLKDSEAKNLESYIRNASIHYGEAECLCIAKYRKGVLLTNDFVVRKVCEMEGILVLDLKDILKEIARRGLISKEEMLSLLEDIEEKDNTLVKEKHEIVNIYEKVDK